ncbi:MAG: quinolinate synthase NadA [Bacteroidia bacterium]|nr:quinolinate synthase NadA [Bacteroidia bacterium]
MNPNIAAKGFVDVKISATLNLFEEIKRLKKEKNAIILAHYYQDGDIQDIADFVGDSLGLSQAAAKTNADIILFAGVHFMAETAKILCPDKKVILPDMRAGCSLAESCLPAEFAAFKAQHPNHLVISYINCTADIKALTDIVCTSSNAVQIVNSLPKNQAIIFAPDKNLGAYVRKVTGRTNMILWDGACMVHEIFSIEKIQHLMQQHPNAQLLAHPECEAHILDIAHFVGSTTAILNYAKKSDCNAFIVATETGILHQMMKDSPTKTFIPAPPNNGCACNDCPHMKLNTLEKVYNTLLYELPEIHMDETIRVKAELGIRKMLDLSAQLGL